MRVRIIIIAAYVAQLSCGPTVALVTQSCRVTCSMCFARQLRMICLHCSVAHALTEHTSMSVPLSHRQDR